MQRSMVQDLDGHLRWIPSDILRRSYRPCAPVGRAYSIFIVILSTACILAFHCWL